MHGVVEVRYPPFSSLNHVLTLAHLFPSESFENPCCCPCYLCACCGGLGKLLPYLFNLFGGVTDNLVFLAACLDCIACGLCAEGYQAV